MSIPTRTMIGRYNGADGNPIVNAILTATLVGVSTYNGFVLPKTITARSDDEGWALLHLWPNVLGSVNSYYKFSVLDTKTGKSYKFNAVVPDYDTYLDLLAHIDPEGDYMGSGDPNPLPAQPGKSATIQVGTVESVPYNENAAITNRGNQVDAIFDFKIPRGAPGLNGTGTMAVGAVSTLPPGSQATVVNVGTADKAILNFGIPQGEPGPTTVVDGNGDLIYGVPAGGTIGQVLMKNSDNDYSMVWATVSTGGGTGGTGVADQFVASYSWEGTTQPVDNGVTFDATTLSEYKAAVAAATSGGKRLAGATAVQGAMGTAQRLTLKRDGSVVLTAEYTGQMPIYNDGTLIGLNHSQISTVSNIATADIDTGTWSAELTGGANYARKITMTLGVVGAGKHLALSADTAQGMGLNPTFNIIVPRSVDGLA